MFDWIAQNNTALAHAGDGMWLALALMVSYYMVRLVKQTKDATVKTLATGILLVATSSVIHRSWWLLGALMAPEGSPYALWAVTYNGILSLAVLVLAVGYSFHIKTALHGACGPLWWARPLVAGVLGALAGMNL